MRLVWMYIRPSWIGKMWASFLRVAFSTFRINAQMGLLTAITIVVALAIDLVLLPSLLMIGHRAEEKEKSHERDSKELAYAS